MWGPPSCGDPRYVGTPGLRTAAPRQQPLITPCWVLSLLSHRRHGGGCSCPPAPSPARLPRAGSLKEASEGLSEPPPSRKKLMLGSKQRPWSRTGRRLHPPRLPQPRTLPLPVHEGWGKALLGARLELGPARRNTRGREMDGHGPSATAMAPSPCPHGSGLEQNLSPKAPRGPLQSPRGCQELGEDLETNLNRISSLSDPPRHRLLSWLRFSSSLHPSYSHHNRSSPRAPALASPTQPDTNTHQSCGTSELGDARGANEGLALLSGSRDEFGGVQTGAASQGRGGWRCHVPATLAGPAPAPSSLTGTMPRHGGGQDEGKKGF